MPTRISLSNYLLLAAIILIGIFSIIKFPSRTESTTNFDVIDDSLYTAFPVHDSTPYYMYRQMLDSFSKIDLCEKTMIMTHGKGVYSNFAGFTVIKEADGCMPGLPFESYILKDKHYFVLPGYNLSRSSQFYTRNGKYYLKNEEWTKDQDGHIKGSYVHKEIPVRFAGNHLNYQERGLLLVPIAEQTFKWVRTITYIFVTVLALYAILILIILPFRILFSIARGKPLHRRNILYLGIIGWSLVGFGIIPALLSLLFSGILASVIPEEIYLPLQETLLQNSGLLVAGLVVLLIRAAFHKGMLAQERIETVI